MKKRILLALALMLALTCLTACGNLTPASDLAYVQEKGTMIVGITDYAPMDFPDGNGGWTGFDAEFAQMFCDELGVACEFYVIEDWDKKFEELEQKTIDVIWNGMTINEDVKINTNCSNAYVINAQVMVMKADVVYNYTNAASLANLTFAVEKGSAGQDAAIGAGIPEDQIVPVQNQAAALKEVSEGNVDACVIDITMARAMTGANTSYTDLASGISLTIEEYGIGFRKNSDITAKINELMALWKDNGTLQALADKYSLTLAN